MGRLRDYFRLRRGLLWLVAMIWSPGSSNSSKILPPSRHILYNPAIAQRRGEKGDRSNLCEAPSGPFLQIGPVPFFLLVG